MSPDEAGKQILSRLKVTREDVARAKSWLLKSEAGYTHELADRWLTEQNLVVPKDVNTDLPNCADLLGPIARAYSVRLAFYQAVWELVSVGELIPAGPPAVLQDGESSGVYIRRLGSRGQHGRRRHVQPTPEAAQCLVDGFEEIGMEVLAVDAYEEDVRVGRCYSSSS